MVKLIAASVLSALIWLGAVAIPAPAGGALESMSPALGLYVEEDLDGGRRLVGRPMGFWATVEPRGRQLWLVVRHRAALSPAFRAQRGAGGAPTGSPVADAVLQVHDPGALGRWDDGELVAAMLNVLHQHPQARVDAHTVAAPLPADRGEAQELLREVLLLASLLSDAERCALQWGDDPERLAAALGLQRQDGLTGEIRLLGVRRGVPVSVFLQPERATVSAAHRAALPLRQGGGAVREARTAARRVSDHVDVCEVWVRLSRATMAPAELSAMLDAAVRLAEALLLA